MAPSPLLRARRIHCELLAALLAANCSTTSEPPPRSPSDLENLNVDLTGELARREALADPAGGTHDPVDFWNSVVEVASPAVRAARREVAATEAEARAIGPGVSPEFEASHIQNGSSSMRETELMLALDVAGLVGAGRSGAAKARAVARSELARAELEEARNVARRDLFAALAALASARALASDLATLQDEAVKSLTRIDLLDQRGWLPPTEVVSARAMAHHVVARRAEQFGAIAQARAVLVRASGLAPDSPMLDDDAHAGVALVQQLASAAPSEHEAREVRGLLALQPSLQVARARLVEAEAEVRIACAEQWPALLIGPKARFTADDFLFGGLLRLELPWPQAASAAVDAARARRDEAHAALADAFAAAQARQSAAVNALMSTRESADEHARIIDQASARRWIAARARFAVDPSLLNDWTMALDQREQALTANSAALRDYLQASFEFAAARGPDPEPPREPAPAAENRHE